MCWTYTESKDKNFWDKCPKLFLNGIFKWDKCPIYFMGRKKGPDPNKVKKIMKVLREKPEGLWIREIARRANLSKSTAHRYITEYMEDRIEEVVTVRGSLVKFVRLKGK